MSFLGSLLSDITGAQPYQAAPKPANFIHRPRSAGPNPGRPTTPVKNGQDALKRKSEEPGASSVSTKLPKLENGNFAPVRSGSAAPADKASKPQSTTFSNGSPPKPTARPQGAVLSNQKLSNPATKPHGTALSNGTPSKTVPKPQGAGQSSGTPSKPSPKAISKAPQPQSAASAALAAKPTAAAPPKKGSFRDLMERGKRAHEAQKDLGLGQIKHKEVSKLTRRERLKLALQEKQKANGQIQSISGPPSRPNSSHSQDGKSPASITQTPKKTKTLRPTSEYRGTMRSQPPKQSYKTASSNRAVQPRRPISDPYESEVLETDDEGCEKQYRYAGSSDEEDDSDDMIGGGFDELEAEEEASLRAARKEDAEAQRQEEVHRTEKMARRRQLDKLKKARAAKGL